MTSEGAAIVLAAGIGFFGVYNGSPIGAPIKGDGFEITADHPAIMTQGSTQTIAIRINRAWDFDRNINLQVAAPNGIIATLETKHLTLRRDGVVEMTVSIDPNAPTGLRVITIAAIPEAGGLTTLGVQLYVQSRY